MRIQLNLSVLVIAACVSMPCFASNNPLRNKVAICAGCHGQTGIGVSDAFPNLAGQKKAYLEKQLKAFKSGDRKNPTMNAMAVSLSDTDIDGLTRYFSRQSIYPKKVHQKIQQTKALATQHALVDEEHASKKEFPQDVYISMKKSGVIERFPAEKIWSGRANMLYDAITPDGKRVLATSPSENTVTVFDVANGKQLAVIPVGKAPKGVKVSPDGKQAYIVNQGSATISVVNMQTLKVVHSIKTKAGPHNVRFTRNGKIAYVTLQGGAGIGVIDTAKQKMIKVIPVPGIIGPHNIDLSKDEKTAFVRDFVHHVAVLDLSTGKVKKVITVGNGHGGIDVAPNGHFVVTGAIGDDFISIINTQTLRVTNIKVGNGPHGVRFSKDSQWIYVTVTKDNVVAVINAKTMQLEKKIAVGKFPFWIAVRGNP